MHVNTKTRLRMSSQSQFLCKFKTIVHIDLVIYSLKEHGIFHSKNVFNVSKNLFIMNLNMNNAVFSTEYMYICVNNMYTSIICLRYLHFLYLGCSTLLQTTKIGERPRTQKSEDTLNVAYSIDKQLS